MQLEILMAIIKKVLKTLSPEAAMMWVQVCKRRVQALSPGKEGSLWLAIALQKEIKLFDWGLKIFRKGEDRIVTDLSEFSFEAQCHYYSFYESTGSMVKMQTESIGVMELIIDHVKKHQCKDWVKRMKWWQQWLR